ncbi:sphingomyelin phosphodiesterase [Sarcoptes scabiei]|nr:sphingomyelin phosphodiesterase [Sarcoptes scabiei]
MLRKKPSASVDCDEIVQIDRKSKQSSSFTPSLSNQATKFTNTTPTFTQIDKQFQQNHHNQPQQQKLNQLNIHPESSTIVTSSSNSSNLSKLTHRRGFSHGSGATLNPSSSANHKSNIVITSQLGSLNRNITSHSNPSEIFYPIDRRNLFQAEQSLANVMIRKSNSNDQVDSGNGSGSQSALPNDEAKRAIAQIEQKLQKFRKAITEEQMRCNDNVNEYLKLASNAEPSQSQRIKTLFEKNNQKSSQKIARYQKKINQLDEKMEAIKNGGQYHRHTRERLRDVGTNIKEGISGLSGGVIEGIKYGIHTAGETVIAKPKEFFKRSTAESIEKNSIELDHNNEADNCHHQQQLSQNTSGNSGPGVMMMNIGLLNSNSHSHSHSTKCTTDDDSSSITSESGHLAPNLSLNNIPLSGSPSVQKYKKYSNFIEQLQNRIDEKTKDFLLLSEEIISLKKQFQSDTASLNTALLDEKYRVERLEEQLNDLTELHQKEIENLKQTISDLEEKIQYQTEERHRDIHEMLETFQTRISRMEHQQHQHLQQLVNLDSLDNSNARALVLKLINVLLTVLQVILLLVATVANILAPFLQTR